MTRFGMTKFGNKTQQHGGTVVGIIIGLIIGLAIALVVAVVISKSSLPFMNKVAKQEKAPELTAGQAADPNKALYGNNAAAKEAEKDFNGTSAVPGAAPAPVPPNGVTATPTAPAGPTSTTPGRFGRPARTHAGAASTPTQTSGATGYQRRADCASGATSTGTPASEASRNRSSSESRTK